MLREYIRLIRPINTLASCVAVFLGGYVDRTASWKQVTIAAISVFLISASTNAWNDYIDIEIDKINKPERPLPAGKISPRGALTFSFTVAAFSLVAAIFINLTGFLIVLAVNILLYLYSWKLKCTVLLGNVTVATIVALCFVFAGVASGNITSILTLSVTTFFYMLGSEIMKDMADYQGDLLQNCSTIATVWGKKISSIFVQFFLGMTIASMLNTYFFKNYHPAYLFMILFIMVPFLIYIILHTKENTDSQLLERFWLWIRFSYFLWFLAIVLGIGLNPTL